MVVDSNWLVNNLTDGQRILRVELYRTLCKYGMKPATALDLVNEAVCATAKTQENLEQEMANGMDPTEVDYAYAILEEQMSNGVFIPTYYGLPPTTQIRQANEQEKAFAQAYWDLIKQHNQFDSLHVEPLDNEGEITLFVISSSDHLIDWDPVDLAWEAVSVQFPGIVADIARSIKSSVTKSVIDPLEPGILHFIREENQR